MNRIEFKELEFPMDDVEKELYKIELEWSRKYRFVEKNTSSEKFYFANAEQIAKEKAEILNKKVELTKDDIIKVFEAVGFEDYAENCYHLDNDILTLVLNLKENCLFFHIEGDVDGGYNYTESFNINFNNIESIKFYYKQFTEMLNFELSRVGNE